MFSIAILVGKNKWKWIVSRSLAPNRSNQYNVSSRKSYNLYVLAFLLPTFGSFRAKREYSEPYFQFERSNIRLKAVIV